MAGDAPTEAVNKKAEPAEPKPNAIEPGKDHVTPQAAATEKPSITPIPDKAQLQAQREATATKPESVQQLVNNKDIPQVTLENGVKPTDSTQAQVMTFLQQRLASPEVLASITPPDKPLPNETPDQYAKREQDIITERQKEIRSEMSPDPKHPENGTWGQASQEALRDYLNWVQGKVVPGAVSSLASAGLPEVPGSPLPIPPGMSTQEYETKVASKQLNMNMGIDYHEIPSIAQVQKLEDAVSWSLKAADVMKTQQLQLQDKQINAAIDNMGFPKGWHYSPEGGPGTNDSTTAAARSSATNMIDLYSKIKRAVDVIDSSKIPMDLPPGIKVTRGADGKITSMELPMPKDLRQDDPTNAKILEQNREWLQAADAKIKNALKDSKLPTLAYSDTVIPQVFDKNGNKISAQARLDDQGNLKDLINPATLPADQTVTKDQVQDRIKKTADAVTQAVGTLSDANKAEWNQMRAKRDGSYTSDQIDFLKKNTSAETYSAAQEHNQAISSPDGYVKNAHDVNLLEERYSTDTIPKEQVAERAKQTADAVSKALAALPDDKKTAYAAIKPGTSGAYSDEQLAFLKANTSKEVSMAAAEHNMAVSSPDGYVKVTQHVQAQETPWFSPQNLIYTNVGNPMVLDERFYKPNDLVGVKDGGSTEYITAKDLQNLQTTQAFGFYGTKALILGMDAAMLAMGGVEIAAAIEGAAALGTEAAVMSGARVALTAGKGVLDLSLGMSEPVSNAYWESRDGGAAASMRGYAFLGSMGWGLAAQGLARFSTGFALDQAQNAAQVGELVNRSSSVVQTADKVSKAVMTWGQIPMAGQMTLGIADQLIHWDSGATAGVQADAVNAYNGIGDNQKPAPGGPGGVELSQTPDQINKSMADYKATLLQNTADAAARKQISDMFDTAAKLSATGSDAQKEAFKQSLAANLEFNGSQIARIEGMYGQKLSQDQLKQLMDPSTRDAFPNKDVRDYANSVMNGRNANVNMASEMILLEMARAKDGKLGNDKVVSTTTNVDSYLDLNALNQTIPTFDSDPFAMAYANTVRGEKQTVDLDANYLKSALQSNLGRSDIGSSAVAVGDELVKSGAINARSYGTILQDVLKDPKTSDADKMRLLSSNNQISFGEVLLAVNAQDAATRDAVQSGKLSAADAAAAAGRDYGTSAADLQKALSEAAASSNNPDFKAMAAALLYAGKRSLASREEGAGIMDGVSAMYQKFEKGGFKPGEMSQMASTALQQQLTQSDKTDVQTRIDAAASLISTNQSLDANTNKMISLALAESFSSATDGQKAEIVKDLLPDRLKELAKDNPVLAEQVRVGAIESLKVSSTRYDAAGQAQAVDMFRQIPALLDGASDKTKAAFQHQIDGILGGATPSTYSDLKTAAIQSLAALGSQDNVELLEKVAGSDSSGIVRASALQALDKLADPQLAGLVDSRLGKDPDVAVEKILGDLKYKLAATSRDASSIQGDAALLAQQANVSDLSKFVESINERYPQLAKFDQAAQSKWLADNFPLLNHDNFIKEAQLAVKERHLGLFTSTLGSAKEAADGVAAQRDAQFQQLLSYASMDPAVLAQGLPGPAAAQIEAMHENAIAVLGSIIASHGNVISPAETSFYTQLPRRRGLAISYDEKSPDWSAQAAKALIDTAQLGRSERDLAARYISMALASKPTGATREALLQAWKDVNAPVNGATPIAASLYDYISKLNS